MYIYMHVCMCMCVRERERVNIYSGRKRLIKKNGDILKKKKKKNGDPKGTRIALANVFERL